MAKIKKYVAENKEETNALVDKAINYIKENCLTFTEWEEVEIGHLRYIQPKGKIKYKALSKNKVKELLEILVGEDNDK